MILPLSDFSQSMKEDGPNIIFLMAIIVIATVSLFALWMWHNGANRRYKVVQQVRGTGTHVLEEKNTKSLQKDLEAMNTLFLQGVKKYDDDPWVPEQIIRIEAILEKRGALPHNLQQREVNISISQEIANKKAQTKNKAKVSTTPQIPSDLAQSKNVPADAAAPKNKLSKKSKDPLFNQEDFDIEKPEVIVTETVIETPLGTVEEVDVEIIKRGKTA